MIDVSDQLGLFRSLLLEDQSSQAMQASGKVKMVDGSSVGNKHPQIFFQGVRVDNIDTKEALRSVEALIRSRGKTPPRKVFFTNVHSIHLTRDDEELRRGINNADLVLPDGTGLKIAGRVLGRPILENLNGTDFTPKVLELAARNGWTVYLFGARTKVVEKCRQRLQIDHPSLRIVGHHQGHVAENEEQSILLQINRAAPDILLVALGSPFQEKWVIRNAVSLDVGVCFAVGGLFDFLAGEFRRAPAWLRRIGGESVYRFIQDPRTKWRRLIIEPPIFLMNLIIERLSPTTWADPGSCSNVTDEENRAERDTHH